MITTTTIQHDFTSMDSLASTGASTGLEVHEAEERKPADAANMYANRSQLTHSTTVLTQYIVEMELDATSPVLTHAIISHEERELEVFAPVSAESERRVRFHVKKRVKWSPNPMLTATEDEA